VQRTVNRLLAAVAVLGLLGMAGAAAYQAQRERAYRDLLAQGDRARDADAAGAIGRYTEAIQLRPDSVLAHLRRGETYLTLGDLGRAAGDFRRASELDPLATRALEALGEVRERRGWYPQAVEAYEARLALDDTSAPVTYRLALARYRSADIEGAIRTAERALTLSERLPEAHYLIGMCLRDRRRPLEAIAAFQRAVAIQPGLMAAREELADLFGQLGRTAEEIEQIQIMAGLGGDRQAGSEVAVGLAHARASRTARDPARRQRHADLAVLTLRGALDDSTDPPFLHGVLGGVWLTIAEERDDPVALANALDALSRVVGTDAATSEVLAWYGRALRMDGQIEAALHVLEEATRRFPVAQEAFIAYADLAEAEGQFERARLARLEHAALRPAIR
jgi:tetratricopeptide (TPR) repeat protein